MNTLRYFLQSLSHNSTKALNSHQSTRQETQSLTLSLSLSLFYSFLSFSLSHNLSLMVTHNVGIGLCCWMGGMRFINYDGPAMALVCEFGCTAMACG